MNIRLPDINGLTDSERIAQIHDYLFTLARELNFALLDIDRGEATVTSGVKQSTASKAEMQNTLSKAETTDEIFTALKPLIIKNADIIKSYSEEISKDLSGVYVAQSSFGKYTEETKATIEANSKSINQYYKDVQNIESSFAPGTETAIVKTTNATITTGLLDYDEDGNAVYGMEISTVTDGINFASARFLSTGVIIYDESGNKALIITDNTITAENINVSRSFTVGGMRTTVNGSVITGKYVG